MKQMELKPTNGDVDLSTLQKKLKPKSLGKIKLTPKQQKLLKIGLIVLAVILAFALTAKISYDRGYKQGRNDGRKEVAATSNLLNNASTPFQSVTGKVSEVKDNKVVVDTIRGEKKTVALTDKTKITKKRTTLKTSDLKKGQSITVFTQGSGDDIKATRIVVRD